MSIVPLITPRPLPARYHAGWGAEFWERVDQALRPGASVLDVGAGRRPTIPPGERPEGVYYVGLDRSAGELTTAPEGSYDDMVAVDAHVVFPALADRFDLILMWQVLEHFEDLAVAASVLRRYARDGGVLVAQLSGRNAVYAIANRVLPEVVSSRVVSFLMRRPSETVFPARYDRCSASGLREAFAEWSCLEVIPFWRGAGYFTRLGPLRNLYLSYENWIVRTGREDLATHYMIAARKPSE